MLNKPLYLDCKNTCHTRLATGTVTYLKNRDKWPAGCARYHNLPLLPGHYGTFCTNYHIMKILRLLLLFLIVVNSSLSFGQRTGLTYRKLKNTSEHVTVLDNDSLRPYYISSFPITNIEYITFLCWLANVYIDYPIELLKAFPDLEENYIDSLANNNFKIEQFPLLINSSKINREYIFNPKFLYYPVTGITWVQAMQFCFWLSDRYNESVAIRVGLLKWNSGQRDEANFNTEAYINDQYEGIISHLIFDPSYKNNERPAKWKDRIFYPSFRLPSKNELFFVKDLIEDSITFSNCTDLQ